MIALHLSDSTADIICNTGLHGKIRTVYPRQCSLSHGSGYFSFALLINTAPLPKKRYSILKLYGEYIMASCACQYFSQNSVNFFVKIAV